NLDELILEVPEGIGRLTAETSHPSWLLECWVKRYGEIDARALALAANRTPRSAFRFNTRVATQERTRAWFEENGVSIRDSALVPNAAVIEAGQLPPKSEPVRDGWVYLQDETSQLVARLAVDEKFATRDTTRPVRALDLCAAPGGKTTLLASLLPESATIVAGDLHHHRLRTMTSLAHRLGIDHICPIQIDATRALPFAEEGLFDLVLLDAPCSGLGTLQRHPEIKWRVTAQKISELAALQKQLIETAAGQVQRGGMLTYSVCSTEPEEGEEVVAYLKSRHPEFRDVTGERLRELGHDPAEMLTSSQGARSFTHRNGTESFFFCVLWKRR
ncbi:MAG: RsmB/NOP family class I SAM-dependent RNA methyltransferase, partial [Acidobacteriota bacterium]